MTLDAALKDGRFVDRRFYALGHYIKQLQEAPEAVGSHARNEIKELIECSAIAIGVMSNREKLADSFKHESNERILSVLQALADCEQARKCLGIPQALSNQIGGLLNKVVKGTLNSVIGESEETGLNYIEPSIKRVIADLYPRVNGVNDADFNKGLEELNTPSFAAKSKQDLLKSFREYSEGIDISQSRPGTVMHRLDRVMGACVLEVEYRGKVLIGSFR